MSVGDGSEWNMQRVKDFFNCLGRSAETYCQVGGPSTETSVVWTYSANHKRPKWSIYLDHSTGRRSRTSVREVPGPLCLYVYVVSGRTVVRRGGRRGVRPCWRQLRGRPSVSGCQTPLVKNKTLKLFINISVLGAWSPVLRV